MVDISKHLTAYQLEIDRIKTQLATPTTYAKENERRAGLFRELVTVRQEYGMWLRITRSQRTLISKLLS